MMHRILFLLFLSLLLFFADANQAFAQKVTNTVAGIAGEDPEQGRSPALTVSTEKFDGFVQILADSFQRNSEYTQYPTRFEFYVNGRLISTQIRTEELPRGIGVDVTEETAPLPFNYSVLAQVITPQGELYSTILNGAVFPDTADLRFDEEK